MAFFIELLKAFLFGIVEGITEWLPISSTGHLILLEEFVKFDTVSSDFFEMFEVVIQLGAIIAVAVIFWQKIQPFASRNENKNNVVLGFIKRDKLDLWMKILAACIPAAVVGLVFDDIINELFYNSLTVGIMLILVGIAFIVVERNNKSKSFAVTSLDGLTFKRAIGIGVFQLIAAILPGTSRSGATILGGLMLGVDRTTSAEFTFFLGIPVMFGASLLKLVKFGFDFTFSETAVLLVGMLTAFAVSMVCIKFLMNYIKRHDFCVFGIYRIILGAIVIAYFAFGKIFA